MQTAFPGRWQAVLFSPPSFENEDDMDLQANVLRQLKNRFGTWRAALIAYNWGPGNLARALAAGRPPLVAAQAYADDIIWDALA